MGTAWLNGLLVILAAFALSGSCNAQNSVSSPPTETEALDITAAIFDFEASAIDSVQVAATFTKLLMAKLANRLKLVERQELSHLLAETEMTLGGVSGSGKTLQVGQMLGAQAVITGKLVADGAEKSAQVKIVSVASSRVFTIAAKVPPGKGFFKLASLLADMIVETLASNLAVFSKPELPKQAEVPLDEHGEVLSIIKKLAYCRGFKISECGGGIAWLDEERVLKQRLFELEAFWDDEIRSIARQNAVAIMGLSKARMKKLIGEPDQIFKSRTSSFRELWLYSSKPQGKGLEITFEDDSSKGVSVSSRPPVKAGSAETAAASPLVGNVGVTVFHKRAAREKDCAVSFVASPVDIAHPFETVCKIYTTWNYKEFVSEQDIIEGSRDKFRESACVCGADAVLYTGIEKRDHGYAESIVFSAVKYLN